MLETSALCRRRRGQFRLGRGTLDDKASVGAIREAVEWLIGHGFGPRRTIYLAFGHNEELGGFSGALEIASLLNERAGRLAFLVDEGGVVAPDMPMTMRLPIANLWAFRPVIVRALLGNPRTAAMLRTTTVATMVSGRPKENVLPIVARGLVNFRILPRDTPEHVREHVIQTVAGTSVHVEGRGREASPPGRLQRARVQGRGEDNWATVPGGCPGPIFDDCGTDTRRYEGLTRNVYRFNPIVATTEMVSGAHGTDERVRADDFVRAARFFAQLIRNAQ